MFFEKFTFFHHFHEYSKTIENFIFIFENSAVESSHHFHKYLKKSTLSKKTFLHLSNFITTHQTINYSEIISEWNIEKHHFIFEWNSDENAGMRKKIVKNSVEYNFILSTIKHTFG